MRLIVLGMDGVFLNDDFGWLMGVNGHGLIPGVQNGRAGIQKKYRKQEYP